ncbi:putative ribonuclease H protein [Senna tora]|uniref:Putative ribonuclease H protein n=1 Tax=Senna tora TaxID=362788 RepID=A0A834SQ73_9FABA|nr:putative ribonuclease H protein [Senna tora]
MFPLCNVSLLFSISACAIYAGFVTVIPRCWFIAGLLLSSLTAEKLKPNLLPKVIFKNTQHLIRSLSNKIQIVINTISKTSHNISGRVPLPIRMAKHHLPIMIEHSLDTTNERTKRMSIRNGPLHQTISHKRIHLNNNAPKALVPSCFKTRQHTPNLNNLHRRTMTQVSHETAQKLSLIIPYNTPTRTVTPSEFLLEPSTFTLVYP